MATIDRGINLGKFNGILLVSDLDGTLLNDYSKVPLVNIEAINYFVNNGGLFTIATGRNELTCLPFIKDITINAPTILYNGSAIYDFDKNTYIWQSAIAKHNGIAVINSVLRQFPMICIEVYCGGPVLLVNKFSKMDIGILEEGQAYKYADICDLPEKWYKIMFFADNKILVQVEKFLKSIFSVEFLEYFFCMFSDSFYYEMVPNGASKGICLKKLANHLNIDISKVVAIGNYFNDSDMIESAGLGVAVNNAPNEIIQLADLVVGDNNGALSDIVGYLDKKYV